MGQKINDNSNVNSISNPWFGVLMCTRQWVQASDFNRKVSLTDHPVIAMTLEKEMLIQMALRALDITSGYDLRQIPWTLSRKFQLYKPSFEIHSIRIEICVHLPIEV